LDALLAGQGFVLPRLKVKPSIPTTVQATPPARNHMAFSLGLPVRKRDTSDLRDFEAEMPQMMSMIPTTAKAMEI
jgi:hypothetical protein